MMPEPRRAAVRADEAAPAVTPASAERYHKKAIPNAVRRAVAIRYGCPPGKTISVPCHYCGARDLIVWHKLFGGRPSSWVSFGHELDHVVPEFHGGPTTAENIVLACRPCNRRKHTKTAR